MALTRKKKTALVLIILIIMTTAVIITWNEGQKHPDIKFVQKDLRLDDFSKTDSVGPKMEITPP